MALFTAHIGVFSIETVLRIVMIEAAGGLPTIHRVAGQTIISQLVAVFIHMAGNTIFIETKVGTFLVNVFIVTQAGSLDIGCFMAEGTFLVTMLAFKGITGKRMVKIVHACWPEDQLIIASMMFRMAACTFLTLHLFGCMVATFRFLTDLDGLMTFKAFFIDHRFPELVAVGAVPNAFELFMEAGEFSGGYLSDGG